MVYARFKKGSLYVHAFVTTDRTSAFSGDEIDTNSEDQQAREVIRGHTRCTIRETGLGRGEQRDGLSLLLSQGLLLF